MPADWTRWQQIPDAYRIFHYWRWCSNREDDRKPRLAHRLYTLACLTWSARADNRLADGLAASHPNWSAVCRYYSMVHHVRTLWFVAYGSYPKSHQQLGESLGETGRVRLNWDPMGATTLLVDRQTDCVEKEDMRDAVETGLGVPDVASRLPLLGAALLAARNLRN